MLGRVQVDSWKSCFLGLPELTSFGSRSTSNSRTARVEVETDREKVRIWSWFEYDVPFQHLTVETPQEIVAAEVQSLGSLPTP